MRFDSTNNQLYFPLEFEPASRLNTANRRLLGGIVVSLLLHAFVLSLQFGIPGLDLPGLDKPMKEHRNSPQALQISLANPSPTPLPEPPKPTVTMQELFKFPDPILPSPTPKSIGGFVVLPPATKPLPLPITPKIVPVKSSQKKFKLTPSAPPVVKHVVPPAEAPIRVITQDQVKNEEFVVPVTSPEEIDRKVEDKKEVKKKVDALPAEAEIDKDEQLQLIEEQKRAELADKKLKDEAVAKKALEEKERLLTEQKRLEEIRSQQAIVKENEEKLQKKTAQAMEESLRKQIEQQVIETRQQQLDQKQAAVQKAAQENAKREHEQAMEEAMQEVKRQDLLSQETLKQEEMRRQAEQQKQRQIALEQEQRKQRSAIEEQLQQKLIAEKLALAERQRVLELAERKKAEEFAEQKLLEQKLLEKNLAEKKLAEQKVLEQKVLEQRQFEQRMVEQRAIEQRLAEQKVLEQKAAEQRAQADLSNRVGAEKIVSTDLGANGKTAGNNSSSSANVLGNGNGTVGNSTSQNLPQGLSKGDFTSRLREQARSGDVFKPNTPNTRSLDENSRGRRRSFLGAYDKEVPLRMYVDSIKHKLEQNGNLIYEKRSLSDIENNVLVNMVIRSDGSIEDVTILRTSGSRIIDEKARNIIMTNSPFAIFPPTLAAKYDVIEVRRVWSFGDKLKILEDMH